MKSIQSENVCVNKLLIFQYQLAQLEKLGLLRIHRAGGFTPYYNPEVSKIDMGLLFDLK